MNDIIKKKILINKKNKELNEEIEDLYQNAEWELIHKYKSSLEMESILDERKKKIEKMQKYNDELTKQIELNKKLKIKNNDVKNIEKDQKIEKQDKYLLDENVAKKELQEIKIKECLENNIISDDDNNNNINIENNNIKENNIEKDEDIDLKFMSEKERDDMITMMVNKIMNEKKAQKIDSILNGLRSKYKIEEKQYIMPEIKYNQKKIDEILYKEMQKYEDI